MKTVQGDLIAMGKAGEFDVIVHGCNCFNNMDAGIAKAIRDALPEACAADLATEEGDDRKLGTCSYASVDRDGLQLIVVNAYTQFDFTGDGALVDYEALRDCFRWIKQNFSGRRIGFPKIGAGLAGGDWEMIAAIIDEELAGEDATLVEFRA